MRMAYGVPVVDSAEELPGVVEELGIRTWVQVEPPVDLETYRTRVVSTPISLAGLEEDSRQREEQLYELECFAPKIEVVFLRRPNGQPFRGFRSVGRNWATLFATVPDPDPHLVESARNKWWNRLVPIVAESKHGAEKVSIGPPSGVPKRGKDGAPDESMADCGRREFEEETGFKLATVEPLAPDGFAVSARQTTQMFWPFFGNVKEPVERGKARLDETEDLRLILVRLNAWVEFVLSGMARDDSANFTTMLALRKMGLLRVGLRSGEGMQI